MGGLLAFRVGNYDNTAEREQFRFLCEQLKTHYENSNDFCVFAGNYNTASYYIISSHTQKHIAGSCRIWYERLKVITLPRELVVYRPL